MLELVGLKLFTRGQHSQRNGQIKPRPFFFYIGRCEIDGRTSHWKFIAPIDEGSCDPVAGFLYRGTRPAHNDDERIAIACIDFHLNRISIYAGERGGADLSKHPLLWPEKIKIAINFRDIS